MFPKGASDAQLLWRLKNSGLNLRAEEILHALTSLSDRGEVMRSRSGKWMAVQFAAPLLSGSLMPTAPGRIGAVDQSILYAALLRPVEIIDPAPSLLLSDESPAGTLPAPAHLFGYYAATQRRDPRGRITAFADTHGRSWQLVRMQGAWWSLGRLSSVMDALPDSFREGLVRRGAVGGAAIGWPVSVFETPNGPAAIPALIVPGDWAVRGGAFAFDISGGRPAINPDWLREVQRVTTWSESALIDRMFPEGEPEELGEVGERLRYILATMGGGALRPADLAGELNLGLTGLHNAAAIFLPDDSTFTKGAADDLESLSGWSETKIAQSSLQGIFETEAKPVAEGTIPLISGQPLTTRQSDAADAALNGRLTVIQGPPGTGKSQVILAVIVSAILSGRSVLFAAKNHQALDEVEARLKAMVPDAPLLTRGRDANGGRDVSFFQALKELADSEPRQQGDTDADLAGIQSSARDAARARADDRERNALHLRLSEVTEQIDHLRTAFDSDAAFVHASDPAWGTRLWRWLRRVFRREGTALIGTVVALSDPAALRRRQALLFAELGGLPKDRRERSGAPEGKGLPAIINRQASRVTSLDAASLVHVGSRVQELNFQQKITANRLAVEDARTVVRHRPVWAISTLSVPARIPLHAGLFDYVIFDEASQCDIASALPLFARARHAVVVGDPEQLRFIPALGNATEHALMDAAGLPKSGRFAYAQSINSLFDFVARRPISQRFFLKDQFRSAPAIVDYISGEFYAGKGLEGRKDETDFLTPSGYRPGLAWENVSGRTTREDGGNVNTAEAAHIIAFLRRLADDSAFAGSVGVLSPFNAQIACIQRGIGKSLTRDQQDKLRLRVSTIDKFQGGEADIILFSLVVAPGSQRSALAFLQGEKRRINVAVSRARALCLVVGDLDFALNCGVRHIERLALRAKTPWSPPRPPFDSLWERRMDTAMRGCGWTPFPQYPVGTRYLDFALDPEGRKLNIEVDGRQWHTDADGNRKVGDIARDTELKARGWTVLRFWVHELSNDMDKCLEHIADALGQP